MLDELGRDGEVVPAGDLRAVAAGTTRAAFRLEGQHQHVREALPQPFHGAFGAAPVDQHDRQEVRLVAVVRGGREQVGELAAQDVQRAERRRGHPLDPGAAVRAQLNQPRALGVAGLGERVGQRRAAVPHPLVEGLLAVQVAEGHVAEPVEDGGGHAADPAHRDVPLRIARLSAGDPGVRHGHRADAAPGGHVGADALRRAGEHARVPTGHSVPGVVVARAVPGRMRQIGPDRVRLQVGHPVDRDRPMPVRQQHRLGQRPGPGPQVHPGRVDQRAAEAEPGRRVVVAAGHDDPRARVAQPDQPVLAQRHRVQGRDRTIVDVTGDEHGVDLLGPDDLHEVIEVGGLGRAEVGPVQ